MSREALVAGRYARALFAVAERHGEVFEVLEDLQPLLGILRPGTRAGEFLLSPLVPIALRRRLVAEGLGGRALALVVRFMDLLLRKKRMGLFPGVVAEYGALVRRWQGLQAAEAVSAVPLTQPELEQLHAGLERTTGLIIDLSTRVDPALIGGLYVRIGDRVMDRSVKGLLESLKERLFEVNV